MSLYKRRGSHHYWCRFTLGRRRIQQSTGTADRAQAEEYELRLSRRIWRETRLGERTGTWAQAVKKWEGERTVRASTAHRDKEITDWFSVDMARLPLSAVNAEVIAAARKKLAERRAPATVNRYIAVMRTVLRAAVGWGWIQYAPKIVIPTLQEAEPRFITHAQFAALLEHLPPHMQPIAKVAVGTGLRTTNIRELVWGRVDLDRAHLWIPALSAKGSRAIGIPLSPDVVAVLRAIPRVEGQERVFLYEGKPLMQSFGKRTWRKACKKAGLGGLRFHDLRHTWASWLMQAGVPPYAIQSLGGWAGPKMVERYAHLSPDHLKQYAAMAKLA
jgi:integrase